MYHRSLDIRAQAAEGSTFLFGPRQTGKTTLLRQQLPDAIVYDLNESDVYRALVSRPEIVRQQTSEMRGATVIIDEIQKLPVLLNEVQVMIDSDRTKRFVLTGSSARSLRRGGVNLLGGRAATARLFPLISAETGPELLDRRIAYGSMPAVLDSSNPERDLQAYTGTYLDQEIRAEGFVRSIETFSRFLEVAAVSNGQILNFTKIASDCGVPARTVREHFQLLEDTLVGHQVPAYQNTLKRKPVAASKFYFFDVGVARDLARRSPPPRGSADWGLALEHLVVLELQAYLSYKRIRARLCFWRSRGQVEVDYVVGDEMGVEVKASANVTERHLSGLRALREDVTLKHCVVVSLERLPRRTDDEILILPVNMFFERLWNGEFHLTDSFRTSRVEPAA